MARTLTVPDIHDRVTILPSAAPLTIFDRWHRTANTVKQAAHRRRRAQTIYYARHDSRTSAR